MNVSLTPELERQIEQRVASGDYISASEVMREALRLFFKSTSPAPARSTIYRRIAEGLAQLDRGEAIPGDEARRLTKERIAARRKAKDAP